MSASPPKPAHNRIPMLGRRFDRLVVEREGAHRGRNLRWICRCDCGAEHEVAANNLRSGAVASCGCSHDGSGRRTHGQSMTGLYRVWLSMRERCRNPRCKAYRYYGARGVKVVARWDSFAAFREDMGERPFPGAQLDRYPDADGDYSPTNTRWATCSENMLNCRPKYEHNGKRYRWHEIAALAVVSEGTLRSRLRDGWTLERALVTPRRGG